MKQFEKFTSTKSVLFTLALFAVAVLFSACNKTEDYPRKPDRLGSGNVKWKESETPDGWTMITNEEGTILGYSKKSGLQLIQVDGYAFKDLNRNNLLDEFEDWRVDFETRAASMVDEIPAEQMMGMKMNPFGGWTVNPDSLDAIMKNSLDLGYRQLRAPGGGTADTRTKVNWNNMVQEYIEGLDNIVCVPAVWIDDPRSGDV
ncbi:MAG: hypothetical protein ACOC11_01085, partial [Prolixibacteraceae bacterium]